MMNYGDIDYLNNMINHLSISKEGTERSLPIKIKLKVLRAAAAISEEVSIIEKIKKDLYIKYGTKKNENEIEVLDKDREEFLAEWDEVMRERSTAVFDFTFKEDDFMTLCEQNGVGLTFKDLQFCQDKIFEK
jgi:RecA-family ATPase